MKKKLMAIVTLGVMLSSMVGCSGKEETPDLTSAYNAAVDSCGETEYSDCSVGSDGSYISFEVEYIIQDDTITDKTIREIHNDFFDKGVSEVMSYVVEINDTLGISDSVVKRMSKTSALDGEETVTENGVTITWKYHAYDYLSVMYTLS